MAEFKPITTQEEFDDAIKDRITRERETVESKYSDYDELKNQIGDYEKQINDVNEKASKYDTDIAERDQKIQKYEKNELKSRVAREVGIPYELVGRLSGDDEKAIRSDAESLLKFINTKKPTPPLASTEGDVKNEKDSAYKKMVSNLKGE